jgi:hypothetical protein
VVCTTTDGAERNRRAFDRAVRRERDAFGVHERAAVLHDQSAEVLEQAAVTELDPERSENFRRRAMNERRLALKARQRSETVRARLTGEGVDVEALLGGARTERVSPSP